MVKSDLALPEQFLALTEKLLAAAVELDWQKVVDLTAERDLLMKSRPNGPWSEDEKQLFASAQQMNNQVIALTAARMDDIRNNLRPLKMNKRLLSRYGGR